MITLVGVGHVFDLKRQVREVIVSRHPRVVGIELDRARWEALQSGEKRGNAPIVYRLLSVFQERVADQYGGAVGEEMIAAAKAAAEAGAGLALIDQDSGDIVRRWWGSMTIKERVKFFLSLVGGLFVTRRQVESEIERFETDGMGYLEEVGKEFPSVKRILIDERNAHMARALREIHGSKGNVVAVVGDGHVEGLRAALADLPLEVVRLRDLRSGHLPPAPVPPADGASVTFTYRVGPPGTG